MRIIVALLMPVTVRVAGRILEDETFDFQTRIGKVGVMILCNSIYFNWKFIFS